MKRKQKMPQKKKTETSKQLAARLRSHLAMLEAVEFERLRAAVNLSLQTTIWKEQAEKAIDQVAKGVSAGNAKWQKNLASLLDKLARQQKKLTETTLDDPLIYLRTYRRYLMLLMKLQLFAAWLEKSKRKQRSHER
ncbi:MAG: hypothetical protein AB1656_25350 [Candidatus Omnitrophota bacterium]